MSPTLPPPPPLPSVPVPTQTVVVNLPPEVVDKLTNTDHSLFTQPVATVTAAAIALIAAAIAWAGVTRQVRAEDRRRLQTARLDLLSEALTACSGYLSAALKSKAPVRVGESRPRPTVGEAAMAALLASSKLAVSGGAESSVAAVERFIREVIAYTDDKADVESVYAVQSEMLEAFKKDAASVS